MAKSKNTATQAVDGVSAPMSDDKAIAAVVKVPDGYSSVEEFLQEARERHQMGVDADRENQQQGLEDMAFLAGDQWDRLALAARSGRPCLTINQMPAFVAQVVGDIRLNRPSIKVSPVEDADEDLAEVREGLIRSIERQNDALGQYVTTGENQVACGIGNMRLGLKYENRNSFNRDITLEAIPNPFAVVWDPFAMERTGRDAKWCFVDDSMTRKEFEREYKGKVPDSTLSDMALDAHGWVTTDSVRVTEYWRLLARKITIALLDDGAVVKVEEVPEGAAVVATRESAELYACMYLITGRDILDGPFELPLDRVPIFRAVGWVVNVGKKRVRFGLIRWAKDPQRLKNYWRSVSAEMLALAPKAKWLLYDNGLGDADTFRNAHDTDDTVLTWTGPQKPELIPPPQINMAVLNEASVNAQDMKDVTGLHDASLGIKSNETSGVAIDARQREGDVANFIYADNLTATIREVGRCMDAIIPLVYDTVRTVRVLGVDEKAKVQKVNDPNDPESVDLNRGKYDISIDTGPSFSTKRAEAAASMTEFVRAVPSVGQVAGDIIARAQDWPGADQIADRLQKVLPPNLQDKNDDGKPPVPPSPEEQARAQQQAKAAQVAEQAAMLELAEKQAAVKKAEADAAKAHAEALKAHYELGAMIGEHSADDELSEPVDDPEFGPGEPNPENAAMGEASAAA